MLKIKYLNYVSDGYGQQMTTAWVSCDTDKFQPKDTYKNQLRVQYVDFFEK